MTKKFKAFLNELAPANHVFGGYISGTADGDSVWDDDEQAVEDNDYFGFSVAPMFNIDFAEINQKNDKSPLNRIFTINMLPDKIRTFLATNKNYAIILRDIKSGDMIHWIYKWDNPFDV